jgi:hypothetical protein
LAVGLARATGLEPRDLRRDRPCRRGRRTLLEDDEHSEVAREAWRSMRNNAVSLSFGYVALKTRKRGRRRRGSSGAAAPR